MTVLKLVRVKADGSEEKIDELIKFLPKLMK